MTIHLQFSFQITGGKLRGSPPKAAPVHLLGMSAITLAHRTPLAAQKQERTLRKPRVIGLSCDLLAARRFPFHWHRVGEIAFSAWRLRLPCAFVFSCSQPFPAKNRS